MKILVRSLSFLFCAAALVAAVPAYADTADVNMWQGLTINPLLPPGPITAPTDTLHITNSGTVFNFLAASPSISLNNFLTSGGDTSMSTGGINGSDPINGEEIEFFQQVDLAPGTYSISHTGALDFSIGTTVLIESTDPTAGLTTSTFTITTDTGSVPSFMLFAVEGTGPVSLSTTLQPTPEPWSLALLGSGVLAVAGMVRWRRHLSLQ
jgi:hypothetical protein